MEKAANHLLSLINDVLQMSKLEDGREELSSELVCLPDVFYDMKAITGPDINTEYRNLIQWIFQKIVFGYIRTL